MKNYRSFLAQRVHVSEILRHFSQFYPTHSRLVYDRPGGSGEEDF